MQSVSSLDLYPTAVVEKPSHMPQAVLRHTDRKPCVVGCILPIMGEAHQRPAKEAAKCFTSQTYPHRKLCVVHRAGVQIPTDLPGDAEVLSYEGTLTPSAMVKIALSRWEKTGVEYLCWWGPYTYSHPSRLAFQMACRRPGAAVCFQDVLRYHMTRSIATVKFAQWGWPHTAIWPEWLPVAETTCFAYPNPREDSEIMTVACRPLDWIPILDLWGPYSGLVEADFLPEGLEAGGDGIWVLPPKQRDLLEEILTGLNFPPRQEADPVCNTNQGRFEPSASSSSAPFAPARLQ